MKASVILIVLISVISAKGKKIKVKMDQVTKTKEPVKQDLPEDIQQGEQFLKQSAADFDKVKQLSAIQAMQNSAIDQTWDLTIPKLENDLESENLVPVRQLNLKDDKKEIKDKGDKGEKKANSDQKENPDRKLDDEEGEDDKLDDVEKRLFSIEDKVDHLLLHAGHEIQPHSAVMTPWGMTFSPSKHNSNSLNNKLRTIDYLFGNHPMSMGGMGMMGHGMGMGMGMMGHGMMGIGHMNPMGVGLDHHTAMRYGMYPYHMLHPVHPLHTFSPYGMYSPYHSIMGYHPIYGNLGFGYGSHSRYRDELEEERTHRYMRHQRDMDDILSKPLLPHNPMPDSLSHSSSSSLFLI
jgi:hypothetical protein